MGFNGKEEDDEIKGDGNSYDYGARFHDPRLGRFLSLDPKSASYPFMSPYCYAANSPVMCIDENGEGPINPLTGHATSVSFWTVSDWEILAYDQTVDANHFFCEKDLYYAASTNREGFADETSYGDDWPKYDTRIFVGKAKDYETILNKNVGKKEKTEGLMQKARTSETFTNHESNFKCMEFAANSGNYVYGEESGDTYTITTVKDHWIDEIATFTLGSDDKWRITTKVNYDITNYVKCTIDYGTTQQTSDVALPKDQITYDLKLTRTNYDSKGKETVVETDKKINTKE